MKIRTCSISVHKGYMCKHAHHSIHRVCLGKFLFPFIQWMGLLCTNSWCCKSVAVTTMRTFSGNLSMPAAETLHNPSGSCHACMTVYVSCSWAALFVCVLNVFVCQHWDWHCSQCMLKNSWPTVRAWITDWLIMFSSLWTVSWNSAKCLTFSRQALE